MRNAVHEYGVDATSLRFFNMYGPRQVVSRKVGVVPIFITRALRNKVITIDGSGEQTRDFTYVADAVEAAIRAGTVSGAKSTTLNIGSGKECAVIDLARMIIHMCKSSSKLVYGPPKLGDISRAPGGHTFGAKNNWLLSKGRS